MEEVWYLYPVHEFTTISVYSLSKSLVIKLLLNLWSRFFPTVQTLQVILGGPNGLTHYTGNSKTAILELSSKEGNGYNAYLYRGISNIAMISSRN